MNRPTRTACAALLIAACAAAAAAGADDILDAKRWREQAYGVSLRPPLGAKLLEQTADDYLLRIIGPENRYQMTVAVRRSKRALTLEEVHQSAMVQIAQSHPAAKVSSDEDAEYAGRTGKRLIFAVPHTGNRTAIIAQGITQVDPMTYVVVDARGDVSDRQAILQAFDAVLATLEVADQQQLAKQRAQAIERTAKWRQTLAEDYLQRIPKQENYYRLMNGDDDRGWMRIRADEGEFNEQQGVRAIIETHLALPGVTVDSLAEYFRPFTGEQGEAWSVRTTARPAQRGAEPRTNIETGSGSLGTIEVRTDGSAGIESNHRKFSRPARGYLTQVEGHLLGRLLPRDAAGEYGFYWYNSSEGKITFRLERVTPTLSGYVVTSRLSLNSEPLRATYDKDGTLIEKQLPGGRKLVRTTLKQLQSIWQMR